MSVPVGVWVDACFLPRLLVLAEKEVQPDDTPRLQEWFGLPATDSVPISKVLEVAERIGRSARHIRVDEDSLDHLTPLPCLLVFRDGSTAILDRLVAGAGETPPALVLRQDGTGSDTEALVMNWSDLAPLWRGDAVLLARSPLHDDVQSS